MAPAPFSISAPKSLAINWWQPGKIAPLDCTGMECVAGATTLPFTPLFTTVNAAQGQFRMNAPSFLEASQLKRHQSYEIEVILRLIGGEPVEALRFVIEAD